VRVSLGRLSHDFIYDPALSPISIRSRLLPGSFRVLSLFFPASFRFARNATGVHGRKALLHLGCDAPAPLASIIRRNQAGVFEHNDLSTASISHSKSNKIKSNKIFFRIPSKTHY
jgi:hypothetical protein